MGFFFCLGLGWVFGVFLSFFLNEVSSVELDHIKLLATMHKVVLKLILKLNSIKLYLLRSVANNFEYINSKTVLKKKNFMMTISAGYVLNYTSGLKSICKPNNQIAGL